MIRLLLLRLGLRVFGFRIDRSFIFFGGYLIFRKDLRFFDNLFLFLDYIFLLLDKGIWAAAHDGRADLSMLLGLLFLSLVGAGPVSVDSYLNRRLGRAG